MEARAALPMTPLKVGATPPPLPRFYLPSSLSKVPGRFPMGSKELPSAANSCLPQGQLHCFRGGSGLMPTILPLHRLLFTCTCSIPCALHFRLGMDSGGPHGTARALHFRLGRRGTGPPSIEVR